ncbi:MAG: hypothetical protein HON90_09180 [Halobacteriovoraceae bacterium]|jgi:hypothetical protein|nr:hypothetical protein [Halobacteriovoraceae bacterium]
MKGSNLTEWEFFVWRHRGIGNLVLHFLSFSIFFIGLILLIKTHNWYLLICLPVSQLVGFMGHYIFEEGGVRSRDFVSPMTLYYLLKIFVYILLGKYKTVLDATTSKVKELPNGTLKDQIFYGN